MLPFWTIVLRRVAFASLLFFVICRFVLVCWLHTGLPLVCRVLGFFIRGFDGFFGVRDPFVTFALSTG